MQTVRVARRLTQNERRILASEYGGGRGRDRRRWLNWLATFAVVVRDAVEQHGKAEGIRLLLDHVSLEHAVALCSGGPVLLPADIHQARATASSVREYPRWTRRSMADLVRDAQERATAPLPLSAMDWQALGLPEPDHLWTFHDEVAYYSAADLQALGERMAEMARQTLAVGTPRAGSGEPGWQRASVEAQPDGAQFDGVINARFVGRALSDAEVRDELRGLGWDVAWADEPRD